MTGILIMDKPQGITSFDVVARLRKLTGERRIGHAGTLDPMATGVLPVFLGYATKLIPLLPSQNKRYEARFELGVVTDTGDATGRELSRTAVQAGPAEVEAAAAPLRGDIRQVPPMVSAKKVGGVRLYELARSGVTVERQAADVTVRELTLAHLGGAQYGMAVACSKGTYIRTLITDLGDRLGCGAVMTALRRTEAAGFSLAQAYSLEQIAQMGADACLLPPETPFAGLAGLQVTEKQAVRFRNGGALSLERLPRAAEGLCRVLLGGAFIGLGEAAQGELKVKYIHPAFQAGDDQG